MLCVFRQPAATAAAAVVCNRSDVGLARAAEGAVGATDTLMLYAAAVAAAVIGDKRPHIGFAGATERAVGAMRKPARRHASAACCVLLYIELRGFP